MMEDRFRMYPKIEIHMEHKKTLQDFYLSEPFFWE